MIYLNDQWFKLVIYRFTHQQWASPIIHSQLFQIFPGCDLPWFTTYIYIFTHQLDIGTSQPNMISVVNSPDFSEVTGVTLSKEQMAWDFWPKGRSKGSGDKHRQRIPKPRWILRCWNTHRTRSTAANGRRDQMISSWKWAEQLWSELTSGLNNQEIESSLW